MAFAAAFLDELKARAGLAALVGKRVRLIRRGREHLGLCPFHKEKTPSFTVNEDKGFYHCFGCGKHGSAFDFVMETEGLSFPEAVERLAQEAGMALPERDPEARARDESRGALVPALAAASAFFERTLRMPEGRPALEYLRGRGLTDETIAQFRLGYAPDRRDALKAALMRDNFTEDRMVEAGLLIVPEDNAARGTYDRFRGRVMFPILDRRDRVIAFGGRVLGDGEPKYLNSPETPLFHKGFTLYGLSHALAAARAEGTLVVVEGYMDVIALHQAGIRNAVAPLGTALTEDQIRLLWRVAPEPVLCFDGDAAGSRAALRAVMRALPLLKPGYSLRFAFMPAGEDPDSMVRRQGADAVRKMLGQPLALSETLWLFETEAGLPATPGARGAPSYNSGVVTPGARGAPSYNSGVVTPGARGAPSYNSGVVTPEARAALEDRLRRHTLEIEDPTVRSHFQQAFRDRAWREFRSARGHPGRGAFAPGAQAPPGIAARAAMAAPSDALAQVERVMLALAVNHCRLFAEIEEELGSVRFVDARLDQLRQGLVRALGRAGEPPRASNDAPLSGRAGEKWTAAEAMALLADPALAATLAEVLADTLIKTHRLLRPDASLADARATWAENAGLHARLVERSARASPQATAAGGGDPKDPEALTTQAEAWERRQVALDAPNHSDEAAE
ncbi:MAG: DNA primase [Rhodospirillales bacterium]|nr:DNA primase [Rhodospirillales bacterium]MSP81239.1 DNA primase [Rhodospirillales bacterium]